MPQERLSRSERRKLAYANKKVASISTGFQTVRLNRFETVLGREDELEFLEHQRATYGKALAYDRTRIKIFKDFKDLGLNEESLRKIYFDPAGNNPILADEFSQMDRTKLNVLKGVRSAVVFIVRNKRGYSDEDDDEIDELLSTGSDIPVIELLTDKTFRMSENVALISMQIDWLREKKRKERKAKMRITKRPQVSAQAISEETVGEILQDTVSEDGRDLSIDDELFFEGRQLYWTDKFFSLEPSHLTALNNSSRAEVVDQISRLGRGQISIKPESVISSVEFHLRRDVYQRALAARNKYGPEGIRDWVKIKRGGDRIFLNTLSEGEAVVFAAGRDVVYRGL